MTDRLTISDSADELTTILTKIASLARELGGTVAALRNAAARLHREFGYTWLDYGRGAIEVRTTLGLTGYLCSRQARTPDPSWTIFVGNDALRVLYPPRLLSQYVQAPP